MITIHTIRPHVRDFAPVLFSYIKLYKITRLNDVVHFPPTSKEYLSVVVINGNLTDLEQYFAKKLSRTTGHKIKFELSDALAVVLYLQLLHYPLHKDHFYFQSIRNNWIQLLDRALIQAAIISKTTYTPARTTEEEYE